MTLRLMRPLGWSLARLRNTLLLGLALLAACGPASTSPAGSPTASAGPRVILLNGRPLTSCSLASGAVALCGTLRVYENRAAHGGRQIDLHIAVVPAQDAVPQPDPVFFLSGGPGGAATIDFAARSSGSMRS